MYVCTFMRNIADADSVNCFLQFVRRQIKQIQVLSISPDGIT